MFNDFDEGRGLNRRTSPKAKGIQANDVGSLSGIPFAIDPGAVQSNSNITEESEMSVVGNILVPGSKGVIAAALATSLTTGQLPAVPKDVVSAQTMQNLQIALNGEVNAHARYLAFTEKADQEGYGAVASLFRAAAAAEEVHGNNHERTICGLGGSPHVELQTPAPRSTRENLEAAISGETYERQKMYPEFVRQARKDAYVPAVITLTQAENTEEEHARLFSEALKNLDGLKGSKARSYYVCAVCGFTTVDLNFEKCKNCI